MAQETRIPTKFLIISDTHNFDFDDATQNIRPFQLPTPKADVLLHCGDLTQVGGISCFKKALKMLASIDAELKLLIPGNHDLQLDKSYWEAHPDYHSDPTDPDDHRQAVEVMTGPLAAEAGVTYLNEGTHTFNLTNGAKFTIYVSPHTPIFGDWAFAYPQHEDRFGSPSATAPIPSSVDIVMTHGPPKGILDCCPNGSVGCPHLLHAVRRTKPLMHCFGHIHEGYGIEEIEWMKWGDGRGRREDRKNEAVHRFFEEEGEGVENPYPEPYVWRGTRGQKTLAVNAAIMNGDYEPRNAPWLVSLELPRSA